jgi:hypothetical protein
MPSKHPLDPADRDRLALRLDVIADQLDEITAELAMAGARTLPAKHCDRARRAAESSVRALDRLASTDQSTPTSNARPIGTGF